MIRLTETLALQSVEDFLTAAEREHLIKIMDSELAATGWRPRHQAEVLRAPAPAQEILRAATARSLHVLQRALPSVAADARWGYTELTEGQCVPTHVDGIPDPATAPRRIGRIGVVIEQADEGGEFYIETTASPAVWTGELVGEPEGYAPGTPLTHRFPHAPDHAAVPTWLEDVPSTRWVTPAGAGTGLAYGAQVLHGVQPVRAGRLRKFVTDLLDTPAVRR
ncbi:hypothetical protein B7P34_26440 [Streptosporangium nondiastaticum]|uniref:Uncharacterized protein n=1 Tax=Streptosporangium nondiastaticum TaxID=35764 RepID=A0A9X7JLB3_9ACTN|nr:hypothetical protein [Streptosporangium nondiastaticum]PSJ25761.1 hypothetical protein B7P34_26440 [Streptosporangium nondiastaticum]